MLTLEFETMGCHARAVLDAEGAQARSALARLPAWLATREQSLSRFDAESELARLNARGSAESMDEILWAAIGVALDAARVTDGLVTPTVLPALEATGYDRSFDDLSREQVGTIASERPVPDWRSIERDVRTRSVRLPPGVRLDLGGTAKGWCADSAVSWCAHVGPALVDLGGDIAASGARRAPWPIAIEDPHSPGNALDLVLLRSGGIATSGRDFRKWKRGGVEQHHIIDPRTGAPVRTDIWTATVIAPSALEAEIAAKSVLLQGSHAGMAWIDSQPELAGLLVCERGLVLRSRRFGEHVWRDVA